VRTGRLRRFFAASEVAGSGPPGLLILLGLGEAEATAQLGGRRGWRAIGVTEIPAEERDVVALAADSAATLRRAAPALAGLSTRACTILLADTDRPGRLRVPPAIAGVPVTEVELTQAPDGGPASLTVRTEEPVDVGVICTIVLAGARPVVAERTAPTGVDTAVASPRGFRADADGPAALLTIDATTHGFALSTEAAPLGRGDARAGLTENHVRALRDARHLTVTFGPDTDPAVLGVLLGQLACAGVPTIVPALPPPVADALGRAVVDGYAAASAEVFADPTRRADWSVTQRRHALRRFGTPSTPEVSVLVPTNRPGFLSFALQQVERQDWAALQTVLVLHGLSWSHPQVQAAVERFRRPLEVVEVDRAATFGQALNAGLHRCSGRLIAKMDDDDWYGPHHITDLVQARLHSGAAVTALASYWIYLSEADTTLLRSGPTEDYATAVHGGTMMLGRDDLLTLGGWRDTARGEDTHLQAAAQAVGARMYGIHDLGFLYYRGHDHTWAVGEKHWLADGRWPRAAGFRPPAQVLPLPHPATGGAS
jgi:hypothetical protein